MVKLTLPTPEDLNDIASDIKKEVGDRKVILSGIRFGGSRIADSLEKALERCGVSHVRHDIDQADYLVDSHGRPIKDLLGYEGEMYRPILTLHKKVKEPDTEILILVDDDTHFGFSAWGAYIWGRGGKEELGVDKVFLMVDYDHRDIAHFSRRRGGGHVDIEEDIRKNLPITYSLTDGLQTIPPSEEERRLLFLELAKPIEASELIGRESAERIIGELDRPITRQIEYKLEEYCRATMDRNLKQIDFTYGPFHVRNTAMIAGDLLEKNYQGDDYSLEELTELVMIASLMHEASRPCYGFLRPGNVGHGRKSAIMAESIIRPLELKENAYSRIYDAIHYHAFRPEEIPPDLKNDLLIKTIMDADNLERHLNHATYAIVRAVAQKGKRDCKYIQHSMCSHRGNAKKREWRMAGARDLYGKILSIYEKKLSTVVGKKRYDAIARWHGRNRGRKSRYPVVDETVGGYNEKFPPELTRKFMDIFTGHLFPHW